MYKKTLCIILTVVLLLLSACGKKSKQGEKTPTAGVVQPSEYPGNETAEPLPDTTYRITWVVSGFTPISVENAYKINWILYDSGLDCHVDFVTDDIPTNMNTWLQEYSKTNGMPDIMNCGAGTTYDSSSGLLTEKFLALTSFLSNDEYGRTLWNTFPEIDWEQVRLDGEIYSVPYYNDSDLSRYNQGLYLSIRKEYAESIHPTDSFTELLALQKQVENGKWKIALPAINLKDLYGLAGYQTWYAQLPYSPSEHRFIDPSESKKIEEAFDEVYKGLADGSIIDTSVNVPDSNTTILAEYYVGIRAPRDGYVDYPISKATYFTKVNLTTGVLKESTNKEIACKVLAICFSNPEIAELINPIWKNREAIAERKKLLSGEEKTELTGFIPIIPEEQKGYLNAYKNDLYKLGTAMYNSSVGSNGLEYTLISGFRATAILSSFGNEQNKAVIQAINNEWQKYEKQR